MSWLPEHISISDQEAITVLLQRLMASHGRVLVSLTLFGSKARGDDTAESDIDILVLVNVDDWVVRSEISRVGAGVSLEHNVVLTLLTFTAARWDWMQSINHPLCREILRDGVPLPLPLPLPVLALQL
jgi:uncharacterized protein